MGSMRVAALALMTVVVAVGAATAAPSSHAAPAGLDSVTIVHATTASPSALRDGWKVELVSLGSDTARVGDTRRFRVKVTNNSKRARVIRLDVLFQGVDYRSIKRVGSQRIAKCKRRVGQTKNGSAHVFCNTKRLKPATRLKPGQMASVVLTAPFTAGLPRDQLRVKVVARTVVGKVRVKGKVRRKWKRIAKDQIVALRKEEPPAPVDDKPDESPPEDDTGDPGLVNHDWILGRWTFVKGETGGEFKITKKGDQYSGKFTSKDNAVGQVAKCGLEPPDGQWKLTRLGHADDPEPGQQLRNAWFEGTIMTWFDCNFQGESKATWSLATNTPKLGEKPQKRSLFMFFGNRTWELEWRGP